MGGVEGEIPPPEVLLERAFCLPMAKRDENLVRRWEQGEDIRTFAGSASSSAAEPAKSDGCLWERFVPSSLRYLSIEYEEMLARVIAAASSGSSLSAARSVVQEDHVVDRSESSGDEAYP